MGLYNDLLSKGYLDATYSVVSNSPGNANCDNYHLFSAEAMETQGWNLWPQYESFYKACEVKPGLIKRYPTYVNQGISQDEMIGAATLSDNAAKRIYEYGKTHWWYFNPDGAPWSLSYWFGRILDFPVYVKLRATGSINILDQILWSVMTALSPISPESNTSGKLLKYVQISKVKGKYVLTDLAIKWYNYRMKKVYGSPKSLFNIYFGPEHPLTIYAPGSFI
jgi:hypothetical protein